MDKIIDSLREKNGYIHEKSEEKRELNRLSIPTIRVMNAIVNYIEVKDCTLTDVFKQMPVFEEEFTGKEVDE